MNVSSTRLGNLACHTVDAIPPGGSPTVIVVLCHGFGAPGTDLVPLGPELLQLNPALQNAVRFVFPQAPLALDNFGIPGGRAWWPIDLVQLSMAMETGAFRDLRAGVPAGLVEARQLLTGLIDDVCGWTGLPQSRIVLGGFSQGAMLSTDVALRLHDAPAGLCVFSGMLIAELEWRELAGRRGPLRVVQSHGYHDPILPFAGGEWLRDMFIEAGFAVEFIPFAGVHSIPFEALERFAGLLGEILAE